MCSVNQLSIRVARAIMELEDMSKKPDSSNGRSKNYGSTDLEDAMNKEKFHRDPMTEVIGPVGPFQIMWHLIMGLSVATHCWQMLANKWLTHKVKIVPCKNHNRDTYLIACETTVFKQKWLHITYLNPIIFRLTIGVRGHLGCPM
jgi:hypothetical protein